MTPNHSRKFKNMIFSRGFVKMLVTCSSVPMWWSFIDPRCTISWIKWYLISMCLEWLWNTGFSDNRIPLWLMQRITVVSNTCPNNSLKSFLNQTTSQEAILTAMYLASAVLKATDFCFLLIQDIEAEPKEKQHLEVLLRNIIITMQSYISDSVSQSMSDCAPKISQKILGTNRMCVMRLNHILAQCVNCKAYVRKGVHQEHQCSYELTNQKHFSIPVWAVRQHYHITSWS